MKKVVLQLGHSHIVIAIVVLSHDTTLRGTLSEISKFEKRSLLLREKDGRGREEKKGELNGMLCMYVILHKAQRLLSTVQILRCCYKNPAGWKVIYPNLFLSCIWLEKLWKCDGEEGGNREKGRENGRFVEEERREVEKLSIGRVDVDVEAKDMNLEGSN